MNAPYEPSTLSSGKFAIGQPVSRKEDPILLRGEGRYSDDLSRPGQVYGVNGPQPPSRMGNCARSKWRRPAPC